MARKPKEVATETQELVAQNDPDVISIVRNGEIRKINLNHPCPEEYWKIHSHTKERYIPVTLVREIMRVKNIRNTKADLQNIPGAKSTIVTSTVELTLESGETITGQAACVIGMSQFSNTGFGQAGRVRAVAIKDALKFVYRFFEGDHTQAQQDIESMQYLDDVVAEFTQTPVNNAEKPQVSPSTDVQPEQTNQQAIEMIDKKMEDVVTNMCQQFIADFMQEHNKDNPDRAELIIIAQKVREKLDPEKNNEEVKELITKFMTEFMAV